MATVGSLVVNIAADVSPLIRALSQAGRATEDYTRNLREAQAELARADRQLQQAAMAFERLGTAAKTSGEQFRQANVAVQQATANLANAQRRAADAANQAVQANIRQVAALNSVSSAQIQAKNATDLFAQTNQRLIGSLTGAGTAAQRFQIQLAQVNAVAREAARQVDQIAAANIMQIASMNSLSSAQIKAKQDMDAFAASNQAAIVQAQGLGGRLSNLGGFFRQAAASALGFVGAMAAWRTVGTIFNAIGAAMNFVADSAIGMNSRLEQAQIGFTSLLGSASQARDMLDQLKDFAVATPFSFPDVVLGTQRLLAMGFAAEEVIPMMESIGNVTAGLGRGQDVILRLVLALGQMRAAGRVLGGELRQLFEAGVNLGQVFEVMSEQTGMSVEALREMQAAGSLSAEVFIDAFQVWSEQNFGGLMEAQAHTFAGAIQVMTDGIQIASATAFKPLFDDLSNLAVRIADFTRSEEMNAWADRIAVHAQTVSDALNRIFTSPEMGQFASGILDVVVALGELGVAIGKVNFDNLIDQAETLKALSPIVITVITVIEDSAETFSWLIEFSQKVDDSSESTNEWTAAFGKAADQVEAIVNPVKRAEVAQDDLGKAYSDTATLLEDNKQGINNWVSEVSGADQVTRDYQQSLQNIDEEFMIQNGAMLERQKHLDNMRILANELADSEGAWGTAVFGATDANAEQNMQLAKTKSAWREQLELLLRASGSYTDLDYRLAQANEGLEEGTIGLEQLYDQELLQMNILPGVSDEVGEQALVFSRLRGNIEEEVHANEAFIEGAHRGQVAAHDLGVSVDEIGRAFDRIDLGPMIDEMETLSGVYHVAGNMSKIFNTQQKEYDDLNESLVAAYNVLNERKEAGLELDAEQLRFLERFPVRNQAYLGAMDDAIVQEGMWAGAAADVMLAQYALDEAIQNNEQNLGPYQQAVSDAEQSLRDASSASGGLTSTNQILVDTLLLHLVPALEDIEEILGRLDSIDAAPSVTLNELVQSPSGGMGFTEFAGGPAYSGVTATVGGMIGAMNTLDSTTAAPTVTLNDQASFSIDHIIRQMVWLGDTNFVINATFDGSAAEAEAYKTADTVYGLTVGQSPTREGPLSVEPDWDYLFAGIEASADKYTEATLKHIKDYVDTAKSIFDTLSAEIEFSIQFGEFQTAGGVMPDAAMLEPLYDFTEAVTQSIGESAALFEKEFLEKAKEYSDAAKAGLDLILSAVEVFTALQDMEHNLGQALHAASDLKFLTEAIVLFIGDSAAMIESGEGIDHPSVRGEGFVGAAAAYAEGAQAAVELIGAAVDALTGLDEFRVNMDRAMQAASDLKFLIEHIVLAIGDSAMIVNSDVDHPSARGEGFIGIAADYAEGAQAAVALVGDALGFISALAEYEGEFNLAEAQAFASDLKFLIEHIAISIADAAVLWPQEVTPAVTDFAEAAGASLSIINDAAGILEIFSQEMDFTNLTVAGVRDRALALGGLARIVAEGLLLAAAGWGETDAEGNTVTTNVNDALSAFADAVGSSMSIMNDAVDMLEILTSELDFTNLTVAGVRDKALALGGLARIVAEAFREVAAGWSEEVNPAADQLAQDVGTAIGAISDIFDFLQDLRPGEKDVKNAKGDIIGTESVPVILAVENLRGIARRLAEAARIVAEEFYEVAKDWDNTKNEAITDAAEAIEKSIGAIRDILGLIKELQELSEEATIEGSDIGSIVDGNIIGIGDVGKKASEGGLDTSGFGLLIQQIIDFGIAIAAQVEPIDIAAGDIVGALSELREEGAGQIRNFVDATTSMLQQWVDSATPLGEDYIDGLIQGLHNRAGALYAAVRQIVNNAIAAAKEAAGVASPSKKMMDLGIDLMLGLAIGIQQGTLNISSAVRDIIGSIGRETEEILAGLLASYNVVDGKVIAPLTANAKELAAELAELGDPLLYHQMAYGIEGAAEAWDAYLAQVENALQLTAILAHRELMPNTVGKIKNTKIHLLDTASVASLGGNDIGATGHVPAFSEQNYGMTGQPINVVVNTAANIDGEQVFEATAKRSIPPGTTGMTAA